MRLALAVQRKARRQRRLEERRRDDAQHQEWRRSPSGQRLLEQMAAMGTKWDTDFFLSYVREVHFARYFTQSGASK